MLNQLSLEGRLRHAAQTWKSPAGMVGIRFELEHFSEQLEAGLPRRAWCVIPVVACGEQFTPFAPYLTVGAQARVCGFITHQKQKDGQWRTVLHANDIKLN